MNVYKEKDSEANRITSDFSAESAQAMDREAVLASGCEFAAYDTQLEIAEKKACRIVKCLYKTNKRTGKIAGINSYVYVPDNINAKSVLDKFEALAPYFVAYLQGKEEEIVKELHKSGAVSVYPSNVGIDKILSKLEAESESGRLTKEKIESWFDSAVLGKLANAFASKLGVSESPTDKELAKLNGILGVYKKKFSSLAGGKVSFKEEEVKSLQKALDVTGVSRKEGGDSIGIRFYARLDKMNSENLNIVESL